jgi:hypothetical protein
MSLNQKDYHTLSGCWSINDIPLSPEAFRVYFHLFCLIERDQQTQPSYREIGLHCFPSIEEDSARSKAIRATKELIDWNLIRVEKVKTNQGFQSNHYELTNNSEWQIPGISKLGVES